MKKLMVVVLIAAAFGGGLWYGRRSGSASQTGKPGERKILYWHDPMHPAYKSDKPGIAPDCGMKLEPVYADGAPAEAADNRPVLYYRDPSDPNYRSDKPGLNPETGNDLEPVRAGDAPGSVQVSADRQQLIGVRYGAVERIATAQSIRAVGKVELDERRITHVHSRTEGWIEDVFADYTGRYVKPGEAMLTIYSPELVASQQEYLLALKAARMMKGSSIAGTSAESAPLVEAARRRLEHWELSDAQVRELERSGKVQRSVMLYVPHGGFITEKKAFPHLKITPETDLFTLVDLSTVWITADVYESDASAVKVGQAATVSASYEPGRTMRARITYILPQVDPQSRTLKVRLEAPNPGQALKPEMFVNVDFHGGATSALVVPREAVIDSGMRKVVYISQGEGFFEPRNVETGRRFGDMVEIIHGLKEGDRIVVSGNFLLDSESQMKAGAK